MAASAHVWVGAETGALKGINLQKLQATNYLWGEGLRRGEGISCLSWRDPQETELLLGSQDGSVRSFSPGRGRFQLLCRGGEGPICGLGGLGSSIVTGSESGLVKVWGEDGTEKLQLKVGEGLRRLRQDPGRPQILGSCGRENGPKIWDLERAGEGPLFRAKNVRNDWLDLRVPVWDWDLQFLPTSRQLVTCTAYGQVRLYDPSSSQRRPVLDARVGEVPLRVLALLPGERSVAVGSTRGDLMVIDLRQGRVLRSLRGVGGSLRGLQSPPTLPLLASCGLDRTLRLHLLPDKRLLHKIYLKSRLSCLLLSTQQNWELDLAPPEQRKEEEEEGEGGGGGDPLWDALETVPTPPPPPKKKKKRLG